MKRTHNYAHPNVIPFPNALTRRQAAHRLLDTLLITVCGISFTTALAFILTLG